MKTQLFNWAAMAALVIALFSCKKDDENTNSSQHGSLKMMIEFSAGMETMNLNEDIVTENNDTIQVTDLQFFISNITLLSDEGNYAIPESYHLVKKESGKEMCTFTIDSIPSGTYTGIQFGLGVDSVANHTNDHSGDLSPSASEGMLWTWETGYKFMKLEGNYRSATTSTGAFTFHTGKDENYKTLTFTNPMLVENDGTLMAHFMANILEVFKNPTVVKLDELNMAHGDKGKTIVENYANGFLMLHHTENMEDSMDMEHGM